MNERQPILEVKELSAYYMVGKKGENKAVRAVENVSLAIEKDEIYGIAGESGCGKTTLIKTLIGLIKPPLTVVGGDIRYNFPETQVDMESIKLEQNRRRVRGNAISYIPQGSMNVLNPVKKIKHSFEHFIMAHRDIKSRERLETARRHLAYLGLPARVLESYPHELSGGMQQRVTIALATILKPSLILADEPTTALDVIMQRSVIQLLQKIKNEQQNTFILITHDMAIHANFCNRIGIMYAGVIIEEADVDTIFYGSVHPYTRYLINSLPSVGDRQERISAPGAPPSLINPPPGCRFHPRCPEATERCRNEIPAMKSYGDGHRAACFAAEERGGA